MEILIVTGAKFPEGDAESVRLHTFGKLLRDMGHSVAYVGMGYTPYLRRQSFDGFNYVSLRKTATQKYAKLYHYLKFASRLKTYLHCVITSRRIDAIFFSDLSVCTISMLKKFCQKHEIRLIADSMEWYSPEQFKMGIVAPAMILKNVENEFSIDTQVKVIAISHYLHKHFERKGCQVIRIPAILDVVNMPCNKRPMSEKVVIMYAGSPGRKDLLNVIIDGFALLADDERKKIELRIVGICANDLEAICGVKKSSLDIIGNNAVILGRVPHSQVLSNFIEADFTILLRNENQRYAKAGFPTKAVESLATATPVMLNLSSDLGDYIRDTQEGIVVGDATAGSVAAAIRRVLSLTKLQKQQMQFNARKCAEENFDYRKYSGIMKLLLESNSNKMGGFDCAL